jgi:hypothetical protein
MLGEQQAEAREDKASARHSPQARVRTLGAKRQVDKNIE